MRHKLKIADSVASIESISQQSGALFAELTKAVTFLRSDKKYTTESILKSEIMDIVKAYTNMSIVFHITEGRQACIRLPDFDANHPFNRGYQQMFGAYEGVQVIQALGGKSLGGVSLKEGRVYGVYENISGDVFIGNKYFNDSRYSDGQLAAIILHELGHLFTYFEFLGSVVTTVHAINCTAKTVMETEDYEKRMVAIKEAERTLGIDVPDPEKLAAKPKAIRSLATQTILISRVSKRIRSETGNSVYELRSCEQLADQFAARHGAGRDLVFALDQLYRDHSDTSTMNTFEYIIVQICKTILVLAGLILFTIPVAMWIIFFNPTIKYYDDPEARVKFIRQQMTNELKDKTLSDKRRDEILADLELVDRIEDGLDDKRSLLELFWTEIIPSGISAAGQEKAMKHLEELLNNELFVQAAKLRKAGV
jgi:uncharacterized protein (DUF488 family)